MKKLMALLLTVSMMSMLFVGCGKEEEVVKKEGDNQQGNVEQTEEFSYPMTGKKKLTYWVSLNPNVSQTASNLADTSYGKALAERTGAEIEYLHPAAGQEREQFNLLVASGDYPDIVEYDILKNYTGGPEKAILDEFILDLTEYMPKYAPNLMKYYESNPEAEKMAKTDTGKYYSFPFIRGDDSMMVYFGPIVRKDWLEDLGIEEPETMDEWYTMLKAFKEEKGASSPLTYQKWMFEDSLGSAFLGAYGVAQEFYLDDNGQVQYGSIQPEYKEFLKEFNKWYGEGLLDADIETVDGKQVAAKMTNGQAGASIGYQASRLSDWLNVMKDDPSYDLVGIKYPVLNKGETPKFGQKDFALPGTAAYVTTACKDIETAMRVLDYGYSEEGNLLFNFGIEGESYEMVDGYPTFMEEVFNDPELHPSYILAKYTRSTYNGPMIQDERQFNQYGYTMEQQKTANANWSSTEVNKHRMPKVTPTPDESQELAAIMGEIRTYRDEMYVRYLFGQESLDTFDEYVNNIKNMGIDRAIEIYTSALERYNNR